MSSKKFTALTFAWLRLLKSDRDLTALAVGTQLIEHFNEKEGGRAWAGTAFMAKELGVSQPTVVRAVHRMHARGRLQVEWGKRGRGHANQYWMVIKDAPAPTAPAAKGTSADLFDTLKDAPAHVLDAGKDAPASRKDAPAHMNHLKNHCGAATTAPQRGRESELALAVPAGALAPVGGAPEEKNKALIGDRFGWLLAIWSVRPWPHTEKHEAADRKAFAAACREADPDAIIAAARAWVAAIDHPRHLPKLADWLSNNNWQKPPPTRRRNGGKVSPSREAREMSEQYRHAGH